MSSTNFGTKSIIISNIAGNSNSSNFATNLVFLEVSGQASSNSYNTFVGFFQPNCGDSLCSGVETCSSCSVDCGECSSVAPQIIIPEEGHRPEIPEDSVEPGLSPIDWITTIYEENPPVLEYVGEIVQKLQSLERVQISVEGSRHYVGVASVGADFAVIRIFSVEREAVLNVGETKKFEINEDNYYDLVVKLESIVDGEVLLKIEYINEIIDSSKSNIKNSDKSVGLIINAVILIGIVICLLVILIIKFSFYKKIAETKRYKNK